VDFRPVSFRLSSLEAPKASVGQEEIKLTGRFELAIIFQMEDGSPMEAIAMNLVRLCVLFYSLESVSFRTSLCLIRYGGLSVRKLQVMIHKGPQMHSFQRFETPCLSCVFLVLW